MARDLPAHQRAEAAAAQRNRHHQEDDDETPGMGTACRHTLGEYTSRGWIRQPASIGVDVRQTYAVLETGPESMTSTANLRVMPDNATRGSVSPDISLRTLSVPKGQSPHDEPLDIRSA